MSKKPVIPYAEYIMNDPDGRYTNLTQEQKLAKIDAKLKKKPRARKAPGNRRYANRANSRPYIRGQGPYQLYGGLEGSLFGQKYNIGGNYYSEDFDPRSKGLRSRKSTTVTGYGPYKAVRQNTLIKNIDLGTAPPMVRNTNKGEATVFNHSEYIGDLISGTGTPTDFTLQSYAFNPGNSELFQFLGPIAHRFQEYEVRGVLFELRSLSSDYASSLSLGSMFMAADYNVVAPAPTDKIQLENMEYANSSKPSCSLIMPLECEPKNAVNTHLYIADDLNYEGSSEQLYDLCNIHIGSYGIPTAETPIAEIWMHYEIALFKPIVSSASAVQPITYFASGESPSPTNNLGTFRDVYTGSSTLFSVSNNEIIFPVGIPGNYIVTLKWAGSVSELDPVFPDFTVSGSLTKYNTMWATAAGPGTGESAYGFGNSDEVAYTMVITQGFNVANDGSSFGTLTLDGTNADYPDGTHSVDIFITSFSSRISVPSPVPMNKKMKSITKEQLLMNKIDEMSKQMLLQKEEMNKQIAFREALLKDKNKCEQVTPIEDSDDESSYETIQVKKKK